MSDTLEPTGATTRRTRLRAFREDVLGWTLSEVSGLSGFSLAMLSRAERGERNFSAAAKIRLARALGVPVAELFDVEPLNEADEVTQTGTMQRMSRSTTTFMHLIFGLLLLPFVFLLTTQEQCLRQLEGKVTASIEEVQPLLKMSRGLCYKAAKSNQLPCITVGRRIVVLVQPLLTMLGVRADG